MNLLTLTILALFGVFFGAVLWVITIEMTLDEVRNPHPWVTTWPTEQEVEAKKRQLRWAYITQVVAPMLALILCIPLLF